MDTQLLKNDKAEVIDNSEDKITIEDRLDIMDEAVRKKYLSRLTEMPIAPILQLPPLEDDLISNVRLYRITEMVKVHPIVKTIFFEN